MIFHIPPEEPPACPRCAALEKKLADAIRCRDTYQAAAVNFREERAAKAALLRELAEEAQSILDHLTVRAAILADDPRLQRLRSVLRRVDAEAGEAR